MSLPQLKSATKPAPRWTVSISTLLMLLGLLCGALASVPATAKTADQYQQTDWLDLLPAQDKAAMAKMPEINHNGGAPTNLPPVMHASDIRKELNKKPIRIAGYIVPVEYDDNGTITEFFLVPYFGACIHVPPPPPNQIIYVIYKKGITVDSIADPFWVNGTLLTQPKTNEMAFSAYSLTADDVSSYQY